MNILVLVKQVPTVEEIHIDHTSFTVDRSRATQMLNPVDRHAVEAALQMKAALGGQVTVLTMGPESSEDILKESIAMGADGAVRVTDDIFAGADTLVTARVLAAAIRKQPAFDAIFCGSASLDGATGQIASKLGVLLKAGVLTQACDINYNADGLIIRRKMGTGYEGTEGHYPVICAVTEDANNPRSASMKGRMASKKAQIPVLDGAALGLTAEALISLSSVAAVFPKPRAEKGIFVTGIDEAEAAEKLVELLIENKYI